MNDRYRHVLTSRLAGETYLEQNGRTLPRIIDKLVVEFENTTKRYINVVDRKFASIAVELEYLRGDPDKGFTRNKLHLSRYF